MCDSIGIDNDGLTMVLSRNDGVGNLLVKS